MSSFHELEQDNWWKIQGGTLPKAKLSNFATRSIIEATRGKRGGGKRLASLKFASLKIQSSNSLGLPCSSKKHTRIQSVEVCSGSELAFFTQFLGTMEASQMSHHETPRLPPCAPIPHSTVQTLMQFCENSFP